jgi:hypothetical protein
VRALALSLSLDRLARSTIWSLGGVAITMLGSSGLRLSVDAGIWGSESASAAAGQRLGSEEAPGPKKGRPQRPTPDWR